MRILLIALAAWCFGGAAMAQPALPLPAEARFAAQGVSDGEVAAMRAVATQVRQITQQHQPQIAAAPDEESRGEAQRSLFARLETLVKAQGLTVERYNQIATLARTNEDLARAIGQ